MVAPCASSSSGMRPSSSNSSSKSMFLNCGVLKARYATNFKTLHFIAILFHPHCNRNIIKLSIKGCSHLSYPFLSKWVYSNHLLGKLRQKDFVCLLMCLIEIGVSIMITPAPISLYKVPWRRTRHSRVAQDWWDILGPLIAHFIWISMEKRFILVSLLFLHFLSSMLTSAPLGAGRIGGKFKRVIDGSGRRFGRKDGRRWSAAGP